MIHIGDLGFLINVRSFAGENRFSMIALDVIENKALVVKSAGSAASGVRGERDRGA
jgi:hypothetical protein